MSSYILSHLILWWGDGGKETSLGVSERHQTSLCVCEAINTGGREPSSRVVLLLKTYLVLTEWVCCGEAPRPSCWRICSHVSTRAHCHLQVPGSWQSPAPCMFLKPLIVCRWAENSREVLPEADLWLQRSYSIFFKKMLWTLFIMVFLDDLLSYFSVLLYSTGGSAFLIQLQLPPNTWETN